MEQKQEKLYALLNEKLDHTEEISDEEILVEIDKLIWEEAKGQYMPLSEKITLRQQLFNGIRRLDILQELLEDESVTEIMVNGTDGIFVEREGRIRCWEHRFVSKTKLEDVVQQIAGKCNRIVNEAIPITDARLENGDRVNIVLPPVAVNGPIITIRRFPKEPITMERLIELGSVSKEVADFLKPTCVCLDTTFLSAANRFPGKQRSSMHFRIIFQKTSGSSRLKITQNYRYRAWKIWFVSKQEKKIPKENMQLRSGI